MAAAIGCVAGEDQAEPGAEGNDEMSDAPERICTSQCGKIIVHHDMKRFESDVEYIRKDYVDAIEAQASAEGFDRGVKEAQPIVESLRAELHSLYEAIGFDPTDLENGYDDARQALDALRKAERERALREALTACDKALSDMQAANPNRHDALPYIEDGCEACKEAIEALIKKDATDG